jgi:hypothetical protein
MIPNMSRTIPLRNIEEDQKLNPALAEMLIEVVEVLPNIED